MEKGDNINNKTYESTIETIAGIMAVNKYNAKNGKKINFEMEKQANELEVIKKINSTKSEIEGKIPGLTLPKNINHIIAEQIMIRMDPEVTEISQIDRESNFSSDVFEMVVLPKLDIEDVKRAIKENEQNGIPNAYVYEQVESILDVSKYDEKEMKLTELTLPETLDMFKNDITMYVPLEGEEYTKYGEKVCYVAKCKDGSQITMTQPDDPKQMPSEEQAQLTLAIEALKQNFIDSKVEFRRNPYDEEKLQEFLDGYRKNLMGVGFDAALSDVRSDIECYGVEVLFDDDFPEYEKTFEILMEELEPSNANAKGFDDDSYATMLKFEIMAKLYNYSQENPDNKKAQLALEKFKNIEPKLFDILEKDPQALEKLQTLAQNDHYEQVVMHLTDSADGTDKYEFIDLIEKEIEQNKELVIDKNYTQKKVDYKNDIKPGWDEARNRKKLTEEARNQKKLTEEEIIQNLTNSLNRIRTAKGTSVVAKHVIGGIDMNKDNENVRKRWMNVSLNVLQSNEVSYEENERSSRKKIFEKIIHEKIYDEDALKKMIEIDSSTVKEVLDELLEMQNSRQEDRLDTIMDLSSKMKEASERKVITADKVEVKDIIENMVGKSDERDNGFEPEL